MFFLATYSISYQHSIYDHLILKQNDKTTFRNNILFGLNPMLFYTFAFNNLTILIYFHRAAATF